MLLCTSLCATVRTNVAAADFVDNILQHNDTKHCKYHKLVTTTSLLPSPPLSPLSAFHITTPQPLLRTTYSNPFTVLHVALHLRPAPLHPSSFSHAAQN